MPEIEVKDSNNKSVGKINISEKVFSVTPKRGVVHDAVVNFLANQRQGTNATKTRGKVRSFAFVDRGRYCIRPSAKGLLL
jgi:large subunit ribosomal protein L4